MLRCSVSNSCRLCVIRVAVAEAVEGGVDLNEAVASESIDQRLAVVEPGVVVFLCFLLLSGTSPRSIMS